MRRRQAKRPQEATTTAATRQLLIDAAREFNAGRYFEAHEVLEEGLDEVPDELWDLFTGLIQIAVGYHKLNQELWSGALRMLGLGCEKVVAFRDDDAGMNLEALRQRVDRDIAQLRDGSFDRATFADDRPRLQPRPESPTS